MFSGLTPRRRRILIWMALGVLALALLAGGLSTLTLQPGRVFQQPTYESPLPTESAAADVPLDNTFETLMRGALAVLLVILPLSVILALFSKEGRKRLLTNAVMVAIVFILLSRVREAQQQQPLQVAVPEGGLSEQIPAVAGEPLPAPPSPPSEEFVLVASVVVVVIGLVLLIWLGRRWLFPRQPSALIQIAEEADRARDALAGGGALEDVVIRSYRQMNKIVAEARELHRPLSATPREFQNTLAGAGLPVGPLDDLTRLFEQVRYGGLETGPAERKVAIDSLTAIAAACREEQRKMPNPGRAPRMDSTPDSGAAR